MLFAMAPLATVKFMKLGKAPVVVLPLNQWKKIENMLENLEMLRSKHLAKEIAKARKEKKLYSVAEVRKRLGL